MAENIIIQGVSDPLLFIDRLTHLTGCTSYCRIEDCFAFRFQGGQLNDTLREFCLNHQFDCAQVPAGLHLAHFGLVAFDMDSTLITIECIDELAEIAGIRAQIAPLTESAMRGEIDFESSFRQRIALLRNVPESALEEVYEQKLQLNPGAKKLIKALQKHGQKTMLITSGFEFFAKRLKSRLGLDFAVYNQIDICNGHLTGKVSSKLVDAAGKASALEDRRIALGLQREQVIAMGDGANDLAMLGMAGTSIAYHAKPLVCKQTTHALNFVGLDGVLNLFE